ncbi:unnamed protein product [Parajaminaea phylloscopi]
MDDPAEIAALCQEYISTLDNVPHEVTHILKEIQHKDAKVQDLLPKISARETQLRELLNKGSPGAPASVGGTASAASASATVTTALLPPSATSTSSLSQQWTDQDKARVEKLLERIQLDYRRADEWSAHKESLSLRLWRIVHAHYERLNDTFSKVAPGVMSTAQSNVAATIREPPSVLNGSSILGAIAAAFGGANGTGSVSNGMPSLSGLPSALLASGRLEDGTSTSGLKRKAPGHLSLAPSLSSPFAAVASALQTSPANGTPQPSRIRTGSSERLTPGAAGSASGQGVAAALGTSPASPGGYQVETPSRGFASPTQTYGNSFGGRQRKSGNKSRSGAAATSGLANVFSADGGGSGDESLLADSSALRAGADVEVDNGGEDERDETLYCFCRKVSYGEMIGCDNEDCKYEWFHLDCVGLSKPLPQIWYCSDCQARQSKASGGNAAGTAIKKEKEGSADPSAGRASKESSIGPTQNKRRKKA